MITRTSVAVGLLLFLIVGSCQHPKDGIHAVIPDDPLAPYDIEPDWSSTGEWILYNHDVSTRAGSGLYRISRDGLVDELIVEYGNSGRWNSKATQILFRILNYPEISLLDTQTMIQSVLTQNGLRKLNPTWLENDAGFLYIVLSPEDQRGVWKGTMDAPPDTLVFKGNAVEVEPSPGDSLIALIESNPSGLFLTIRDYPGFSLRYSLPSSALGVLGMGDPRFSPDGQSIAFSTAPTAHHSFRVWLLDFRTEEVTLLIDGALNPDWSPDGKSIVYTSFGGSDSGVDDGAGYLWTYNLSTSARAQLTH